MPSWNVPGIVETRRGVELCLRSSFQATSNQDHQRHLRVVDRFMKKRHDGLYSDDR
jgi:hypothetical protein